jgi:hypothetical protein
MMLAELNAFRVVASSGVRDSLTSSRVEKKALIQAMLLSQCPSSSYCVSSIHLIHWDLICTLTIVDHSPPLPGAACDLAFVCLNLQFTTKIFSKPLNQSICQLFRAYLQIPS